MNKLKATKTNSHTNFIVKYCTLALILLFTGATSLFAATTTTDKTIILIAKDGSELKVATIKFTDKTNGRSFEISWDEKKFSEHFLSMRPFKCIDGVQTVCHLGYPYKTKNHITNKDLQDLEYALLFIHKNPKEYGINFWNGVYYRLQKNADGTITGKVWETDMNELASPPEKEFDRPIGGDDLVEGAEGKHRFPNLIIK